MVISLVQDDTGSEPSSKHEDRIWGSIQWLFLGDQTAEA